MTQEQYVKLIYNVHAMRFNGGPLPSLPSPDLALRIDLLAKGKQWVENGLTDLTPTEVEQFFGVHHDEKDELSEWSNFGFIGRATSYGKAIKLIDAAADPKSDLRGAVLAWDRTSDIKYLNNKLQVFLKDKEGIGRSITTRLATLAAPDLYLPFNAQTELLFRYWCHDRANLLIPANSKDSLSMYQSGIAFMKERGNWFTGLDETHRFYPYRMGLLDRVFDKRSYPGSTDNDIKRAFNGLCTQFGF